MRPTQQAICLTKSSNLSIIAGRSLNTSARQEKASLIARRLTSLSTAPAGYILHSSLATSKDSPATYQQISPARTVTHLPSERIKRTFSTSLTSMSSSDTNTIGGNTEPQSDRLSTPLPPGTIDSHMHIIPPDFTKFPILPSAQYKPTPHTLTDATQFYTQTSGLGIGSPRMVLTQVSIYGTDNSALLSGLAELGENGRGVVECDPDTVSEEQLRSWWAAGVRGVRINLVSVGRSVTEDELQALLQKYVNRLSPVTMSDETQKWVVEMYIQLSSIPAFLSVLPRLEGATNLRWCLDHFAGLSFKSPSPTASFDPEKGDNPYKSIPGVSELVTLLSDQNLPEVFVKLSAAYRIDPTYPSPSSLKRLGVVGRELVSKAEDRVVWASDWPHTRFEKVDSVPFVEVCYEWCRDADGDDEVARRRREKLFRTNAEVLWSW